MTQTVVVLGANGGLGSAVARTFAAQGWRVILAGRSLAPLQALAAEISGQAHAADLTDPQSLARLAAAVATGGPVHAVINAVGYDVRKSLLAHTSDDIARLLDINLRGAVALTQTFLPVMVAQKNGVILHLGGFADGRLALPFYSVDAATRAGLRTFLESAQREVEAEGVTLSYFCPAPADTDAERPYHPIWREMGTPILPPQVVAESVYRAVIRRQRVHIMGIGTRILAALNAVWPCAADTLILRRYSQILARYFG